MTSYTLHQVNGITHARILHEMNAREPDVFPPLDLGHLRNGFWWLARAAGHDAVVGFCGLVPMEPFPRTGYLKRAYVAPEHRGHGLQRRFIEVREARAIELKWTLLVTECASENARSRVNLEAEGFCRCRPEQPWGRAGSVYYEKALA